MGVEQERLWPPMGGGGRDSLCQGCIRPGNLSWLGGGGAVVLGKMRGKDDEYDYLFKGESAARPALAMPAMSVSVPGLSLLPSGLAPRSTLGVGLGAGAPTGI